MVAPGEVETDTAVGYNGGTPLRWSQLAGLPGCCGSGSAVRKYRADVTKVLGNKDGGVIQCLGTIDPLQRARDESPRTRARGAGGRERRASRSERRLWSQAHGQSGACRERDERSFCMCG